MKHTTSLMNTDEMIQSDFTDRVLEHMQEQKNWSTSGDSHVRVISQCEAQRNTDNIRTTLPSTFHFHLTYTTSRGRKQPNYYSLLLRNERKHYVLFTDPNIV